MRLVWTPFVIVLTSGAILGFFQNCTPAVPFGDTDHFLALVNSPEFPYEIGIDQVAYMSCSEQENIANDGTFFTYRVGAFNSQGLRITQRYRDHIKKVREENVPLALEQSQASAGARLQVAIRTMDNMQLMYVDQNNGSDGLNGSDFNNFFPPMGDRDLSNTLWYLDPADYVRTYASAQFIADYRFEGELRFMKSQIMENDLRTFFGNRGIIAVTFAEEGSILPIGPGSHRHLQELADSGQAGNPNLSSGDQGAEAAGVDSSVNSSSMDDPNVYSASNDLRSNVYGAAVQPRFRQPMKLNAANEPIISPGKDLPPRVLSSINDVVIDGRMQGQFPGPWICPESMQFMIVLPEDASAQDGNGNTRCSTDPDPVNPSEELKIIRQSIYAEDFYVDMNKKCIVPKSDHVERGSCYGQDSNTQLTHIINYDTFNTDGCGFGNPSGLCPHYASVCYRD